MIDPTQRQWLDEHEILERFVLEKLTEEEERRLAELRRRDPALEEEISLQAKIIAGIRVLGRSDLRQRLEHGIKKSSSARYFDFHPGLILKIAAGLAVIAASWWLVNRFVQPEIKKSPMTESKGEESIAPSRVAIDSQSLATQEEEIVAKEPANKPGVRKKPITLSSPAAENPSKRRTTLNVKSMTLLRPNEVSATLYAKSGDTLLTRIFFKNPTDLTAVNIKDPVREENGLLETFYVHYEKASLSVYLDNSRYLGRFQNARLVEQTQALLLTADTLTYRIDLSPNERFKKAIRISQ